MTRSVILAAGEGTRLRPHTVDRPKALVPLAGEPLLERQLRVLRSAGIDDITVVTGYRAESIESMGVATRHNPRFAETNMVASLLCARDLLDGRVDVLVSYADIVFEERLVRAALSDPRPVVVVVDRAWRRLWELRMDDPLADAETLRLRPDGTIAELGRVPSGYDDIEGQYTGLIHVRADAVVDVVAAFDALDPDGPYDGRDRDNMFMTSFLQWLIDHGTPVGAALVDGGWLEVDTVDDLSTYDAMAADGSLAEVCEL